jgi:hypothetical protein
MRVFLHYLPYRTPLSLSWAKRSPAFLKNASCVYGSLIDEDALAATNLGRGQKLPARVRVDAQEVSYLVRSANGWYGDTNGCSECKRESDENESRP